MGPTTPAPPSETARRVAAYRVGFERLAAPFGDRDADQRLQADAAAGLSSPLSPDMGRYLQARTTFFDRVLLNAIGQGNTQVVIVGAGYDGRSLRYAKPGVKWFELDQAETQADKRMRLARLGIGTSHIGFVSVDFRRQSVARALVDAGYEPRVPAVALCEGVAVYLERSVLEALLNELGRISAPGSRLAISFSVSGLFRGRAERFRDRAAALGEPALTSLSFDEAAALLAGTGWQVRELSERARLAGFVVAVPAAWAPGRVATGAKLDEVLARMYHRVGADTLPRHIERTYDTRVTNVAQLDEGVFRVDRADGASWVARLFPSARPAVAAEGDAEILRHLEQEGFPAERLAHPDAVSVHEGQAVLVTGLVPGGPPPDEAGTFRSLGDLLGRLHARSDGTGALARSGGGWHHLVPQGGVGDEVQAATLLLEEAGPRVPAGSRDLYQALCDQLAQADPCEDLPHGLVHPDLVPVNCIAPPGGQLVLVDWTGAGRGPRLPGLGFLLWAAGRNLDGVDAVMAGYRQHVRLDPEELDRLGAAVETRRIVLDAFAYFAGRRRLTAVAEHMAASHARAQAIAARAREAVSP